MIFGDVKTFAIQCERLDPALSDGFKFAHFCVWIAGNRYGDWHDWVSLGAIIHSASVFLKYRGQRDFNAISINRPEDVFQYVRDLHASGDPLDFQLSIQIRARLKYLLHEIAVESLEDQVYAVLYQQGHREYLVWETLGDEVQCISMARGGVDDVVGQFVDWASGPC